MSKKQITANQGNARMSTGPTSHLGKQRSARNAFKHGLSVPSDPADNKVRALASLLSPVAATDHVAALAVEAARRVIDYDRVRAAHSYLYSRLGNSPLLANPPKPKPVRSGTLEQLTAELMRLYQPPVAEPLTFSDVARGLNKLARYERRAFSLRGHALRELIEATLAKPNAKQHGSAGQADPS